jgi:hypothetical protein
MKMQFQKQLITLTVCVLLTSACGSSQSGPGRPGSAAGYIGDTSECSKELAKDFVTLATVDEVAAFSKKYGGVICQVDGKEFNVDTQVSLAKKFLSEGELALTASDGNKHNSMLEIMRKYAGLTVKTSKFVDVEKADAALELLGQAVLLADAEDMEGLLSDIAANIEATDRTAPSQVLTAPAVEQISEGRKVKTF